MGTKMKNFLATGVLLLLAACATTGEPETRLIHQETFLMTSAEGHPGKITKRDVTIEDMGEAEGVVQPVSVQACNGASLLYRTVTRTNRVTGEKYNEQVPVMIEVDPLEGVYVRRLRVSNNTSSNLPLNFADVVLVDPAGNDNELVDKLVLGQNIRAQLPCASGYAVEENLKSLKILGGDVRIRPGRETTYYAMFTTVDKSIVGDWTLEVNDFPVLTDQRGQISMTERFFFPLVSTGFRTTITQKKEGFWSAWEEVSRTTQKLDGQ